MLGREKEVKELEYLYSTNEAQLVAVYGRRRVGKTYLINETFKDRMTFSHSGLSPVEGNNTLRDQLDSFYFSLLQAGAKFSKKPSSWMEAFYYLEQYLTEINDGNRQVIFLDELPWLDTPRSGFITAFESFWNGWACSRHNIMVIVCGSASSWILDNLINNHGGLYNRVTSVIKVSPFSLHDCEQYLQNKGIVLSRYDIAQSYMIFGGIPYYLGYFRPGLSLAQIVDNLLFSDNAVLKDEYDRLFSSIFSNPEIMKSIISTLNFKKIGLTKPELCKAAHITDGGYLSKNLAALIASDFIQKYRPFGKNTDYYKLIDPFCIFYLEFLNEKSTEENYWEKNLTSQSLSTWRGFAFERLCFNHIPQIKNALQIGGISATTSPWFKEDSDKGTQVDLIIDRKDDVVNMCEIKFYSDAFTITKDYYKTLLHRQTLLQEQLSKKQVIHPIAICSFGLKQNEYSNFFLNTITLDDLFENA